ncbi:MAG: ribosome silencing factor [Betaproteobacteria bacterium RBG_16_64_9]|nr:MAG: ribosome silencing factor [Betaproteobacteria bacterium RBG_16_64_9]OGA29211.1 MAG: ribosome silencing factor [Betaproteobacteria bacterium RIFCSPLOWO2_02_FULL_65_24]OGA86327.1 MAG: ribosome silencing factor [Betaproteobacteria bacterium RIFCSPLOWO2_12_FULL_66_14]
MDIRKLQKAVVGALEDIKAHDIEVYDVRHLTSFFDRVVVASADSARQTKALANHLRESAKALGAPIMGVEGEDTGEWVLVDLGDIVVHIMQPAVRAHYNLEELWNQPKPRAPRKRAARTAAG